MRNECEQFEGFQGNFNEEELKKTVRKEEELRRQEEVSRAAAAAETRRQEAEREERERRRQESELAAMRERHLRERVAHISQTTHGQKMLTGNIARTSTKGLPRRLQQWRRQMRALHNANCQLSAVHRRHL
ncbi:hypothetical protein PYW07_003569 [Mythimna separata]|uniref:Uncharacterized protein n=1 Tax=Mythimna separata TaxID=271217 RepID=A0AAD7YPE5_MYTSE|nr:hypothetical protein PYW07_003569 [Mythimna separata]